MGKSTWGRYAPDLVGHEVNGAVVIADAGTRYKNPTKFWRLRCKCGNEFEKAGTAIRNQPESVRCKSCAHRAIGAFKTIHGETGTPEHTAWLGMRRRCRDSNSPGYKNYGGRGIKVCVKWVDDYPAFATYIKKYLGPRPTSDHSIDRIDNDGHYEPGNLRWATPVEQNNNRRKRTSKYMNLNYLKV